MQITSPRRFFTFWLGLILIVGVVMWFIISRNPNLKKSGDLEIATGTSAKQVWQQLAAEGYTASALPWQYHGWRLDAAGSIKAGTYSLDRSESVRDVISRFIIGDTNPNELTITFPEGFTLQQIAERTSNRGIGTADAFIAAATPETYATEFPFLADIPSGRSLEGYLFPDTYQFFPDDSSTDVIRRMLATFSQRLTPELRAQIDASGRTLDEIIIMASIIEREVISDDDMALVSGVLWKRNDEDMGLDADATVRYALDKWDEPLTIQDLATESPYNTRRWRGLPPGPISNPGLRAIMAAIAPEASPYYYYLSAQTGETIFAETNDQHNANKVKYLQ